MSEFTTHFAQEPVQEQPAIKPFSKYITDMVNNHFDRLEGDDPVELYKLILEEVEVPLLQSVMQRTGNNQSRTAIILGLSRGTLRTKLKRYFENRFVKSREQY